MIKRTLDAGAQTIMLPFVESAEEAARAVGWAKYPPDGQRGVAAVAGDYFGYGFSFIASASDMALMTGAAKAAFAAIRGDGARTAAGGR